MDRWAEGREHRLCFLGLAFLIREHTRVGWGTWGLGSPLGPHNHLG